MEPPRVSQIASKNTTSMFYKTCAKSSVIGSRSAYIYSFKRYFAVGSPKYIVVNESRSKGDESQFSCEISSGSHVAVSDLMKEAGGNDFGMSPKELLMASLGSCTVMTIRTVYENSKIFALKQRKASNFSSGGWADSSLDGIFVKVQEWGDHPHVPSRLSVDIDLKGKLSTEQKAALVKASEKCPVKTLLANGVSVDTVLKNG